MNDTCTGLFRNGGAILGRPRRGLLSNRLLAACLLIGAMIGVAARADCPPSVLTYHNDLLRTGQNLSETVLTPSNVNTNTFGKLFSHAVDGEIYGQPLYLANVLFPDKSQHNLVFVGTSHDSVYAFDADDANGTNAAPIWQVSFIDPAAGITPFPVSDVAFDPVSPEVGILSTPVIDPVTQTLYVVAKTKEVGGANPFYAFRLHALDARTGAEKFGGPVLIQASVPGNGAVSDGAGNVDFSAKLEHQRSALLLVGGVVYISWASLGDIPPYHGWIIGYDAATLQLAAAYCDTPNGDEGGIWQGGAGPAADADGNIFVITGNGTFDAGAGPDYGDSALKLTPDGAGGLNVADYFTPYNQAELSFADLDLGSGGVLLLPDQSDTTRQLMVFAGKEGTIYLLDRNNLGHYQTNNDSQILQSIPKTLGKGSFGMPAYFNGRVYYGGYNDTLRAFDVRAGLLSTPPSSRSAHVFGYGGATPSVSANGTNNGVVWALDNNGFTFSKPAILYAYDANDLSVELYNSSQSGQRDAAGPAVRFTVPTVVNGKVYVDGRQQLTVYGLSAWVGAPTFTPTNGVFSDSVTVAITSSTPGAEIHYTLDGSTPTADSPLYTGPFSITQSTGVKAIGYQPGVAPSAVASTVYFQTNAIGSGTGLRGDYFLNNIQLAGPPDYTKTDSQIDFNWGVEPAGTVFATRWTGQIQAQFSETYTFSVLSSDGVRLSIDDEPVIDQWFDHPPSESSGAVELEAGQVYDVTLDYYSSTGDAVVEFFWSSPSTPKMIVPSSQLYPATNGLPWLAVSSPTNGAVYVAPANVTITVVTSDTPPGSLTVEFFAGDTKLGEATDSPYTLIWTNASAGSYQLSARMTDAYGTVTQSGAATIQVLAPPLRADRVGDQVIISWPSSSATYVLEASDLPVGGSWLSLTQAPVVGPDRTSVTIDPLQKNAFYRLRTAP